MAKLAGKKTISLSEVSQEINLKRYLGREPTKKELEDFGEVAIELINNRTLDGKTIHGTKFKKYSKEYAAKKGVTRSSVDMFLSGDMLDALKSETNNNTIKISVDGKDVETEKAYNHITGDTLPKRQFFGITTTEARDIATAIDSGVDLVGDLSSSLSIASTTEATITLAELRAALDLLDIEQIE